MTTQKKYGRFSKAGEVREKKGPALIAYHGEERREGQEKGFWTRVGTAWETKNGDGLNLVLNLIPAGNAGAVRITLLPPREADGDEAGGE